MAVPRKMVGTGSCQLQMLMRAVCMVRKFWIALAVDHVGSCKLQKPAGEGRVRSKHDHSFANLLKFTAVGLQVINCFQVTSGPGRFQNKGHSMNVCLLFLAFRAYVRGKTRGVSAKVWYVAFSVHSFTCQISKCGPAVEVWDTHLIRSASIANLLPQLNP